MDEKRLLKSKKIHVTDFRVSVLNIFNQYKNAISTDQIENGLDEFDRITLYRTLKLFKEKGVIHEIIINDQLKKFALCKGECESEAHHHNHIHFSCDNCHEIYCLEIPHFPEIKVENFMIDQLEIQARGRCQNCA